METRTHCEYIFHGTEVFYCEKCKTYSCRDCLKMYCDAFPYKTLRGNCVPEIRKSLWFDLVLNFLCDQTGQLFLDYQIMCALNMSPHVEKILKPLLKDEVNTILYELRNKNYVRVINNQAWHYNPYRYYAVISPAGSIPKHIPDEENPSYQEMMQNAEEYSLSLIKSTRLQPSEK